MGGSIQFDILGAAQLEARLAALGLAAEGQELLMGLARLGKSQTQRRISSEKTAPDGAAWLPNKAGGSTLFATGDHLYDSIDEDVSGHTARWGTGWIGAPVHQFGATIVPGNAKALAFKAGGKTVFAKKVVIPARPFLGVSDANTREIEATASRFIQMVLR